MGEVEAVGHEIVGVKRLGTHELGRGILYRVSLDPPHLGGKEGREGRREERIVSTEVVRH